MLRFSLLALLLANAGYFAWSQGWMASLGWQPDTQSESFRLRQQIRPDVVQIGTPVAPMANAGAASTAPTTTAAAAPAATAAAVAPEPSEGPTRCLQAGTFDDKQVVALRIALRDTDIPATAWELQSSASNGRWMVYLGKFPSTEAMELRRSELQQSGISYDRAGGALEPGLSLGRFPTEEAATRELTTVLRQGVRGARVVQERADTMHYTLRLPAVTPTLQTRLDQLRPALAGKALRPCEG